MDTFEANGARFAAENDMIVRWCRQTGRPFEPETTRWMLARLAERAGAFVDVGAATGWFAIPIALSGRLVVAIEANARVFRRLAANAALNGAVIEAHPVAASDRSGEAVFRYNGSLPLTSGGSLEQPIVNRPKSETVPTERLDVLVGERPVALVKIDVEGHELPVLAGAQKLIAASRPHLVLEANTGGHRAALAAWCDKNAYAWERADDRNMLCSPSS